MLSAQDLKSGSITKVGVFDSGVGGLTVLSELLRVHPGHNYVYFGDTAHVPYGSRSAEEVVALVTEIARFLVAQGCQGLVLACNTSSALALSALRATFEVPMVGVIGTAARESARLTRGTVAVLANPLTASSGVYKEQITNEARLQERETPRVIEIGCPDLVPIVEKDELYTESSSRILSSYARRLIEAETDTLVLGCTHYPLLLPVLRPMLPPEMQIVNPADLIPNYLHPTNPEREGGVEFRVSGETGAFDLAATKILSREVRSQQVTLPEPCEARRPS